MKFKWGDKIIHETNKIKTKKVYANNKLVKEVKFVKYNFWLGKFTPFPTCHVCNERVLQVFMLSERHGHCKSCGTVFHEKCGSDNLGYDLCNKCKNNNKTFKIINKYY